MVNNSIRTTLTGTSFPDTLAAFLRTLEGSNLSPATIRAYQTDVSQCLDSLQRTDMTLRRPEQVQRRHLQDYLACLGARGLTGVSRARKLAAVRGYFRFLEDQEVIGKSPAAGLETPKKERTSRSVLRVDEYTRLLSLAGTDPRDYAIFQVFLQTGLRVSELCALRRQDVDFEGRTVTVRMGKGQQARTIDLETKAARAIKSYLAIRPDSLDDRLFLNRYGESISERGVRKLVAKYLKAGGITKKASCHSLRHTFATYKAERGVSAYQLRDWLGHRNLNTTQIYVRLGRGNGRKVMEATSL